MISCQHRNFRKHRKFNNSEHYISLEISLNIDFLCKSKVTSSVSSHYVVISGKVMTTSLVFSKKYLQIRKKARTAITEITGSKWTNLELLLPSLKRFLSYLIARSPSRYVLKELNQKLFGGNVNGKIQSVITSMNEKESESVNITRMCNNEANKYENTSSTYDN